MNEESVPKVEATVVHLKDKELVEQICARARNAVLTWLREKQQFVFWYPAVGASFSPYHLSRFLGYGRNDKLDFDSVAKVLTHHSPMKFRTFEVTWTGGDEHYPGVSIGLKDQFEWTDVLTEAWGNLQRPPSNLSEPAARLLIWAQQDNNQNQWVQKSVVGRQAKLRGTSWTSDFVTNLFEEIQSKTNTGLKFEQREDEFQVRFEQPHPQSAHQQHGPLNPVLILDFKEVSYAQLDRFRETLYDWILAAQLPAGDVELAIWHINDRSTLLKCFPAWQSQDWSISTLVDFLSEVALDHGLLWGYSFQDPQPWRYVCCPRQGLTWEDVKALIHKARSLPPLTEQYGISDEAAALVKWFTTLRQKEWLGKLTPPVEDNLEKRIGISTDWHRENLRVYFSMLAEEISERTEWKVMVYPWSGGWAGATHRLLVKRKPTAFEDVVQQIQVLGISQGKVLERENIQTALCALLQAG